MRTSYLPERKNIYCIYDLAKLTDTGLALISVLHRQLFMMGESLNVGGVWLIGD